MLDAMLHGELVHKLAEEFDLEMATAPGGSVAKPGDALLWGACAGLLFFIRWDQSLQELYQAELWQAHEREASRNRDAAELLRQERRNFWDALHGRRIKYPDLLDSAESSSGESSSSGCAPPDGPPCQHLLTEEAKAMTGSERELAATASASTPMTTTPSAELRNELDAIFHEHLAGGREELAAYTEKMATQAERVIASADPRSSELFDELGDQALAEIERHRLKFTSGVRRTMQSALVHTVRMAARIIATGARGGAYLLLALLCTAVMVGVSSPASAAPAPQVGMSVTSSAGVGQACPQGSSLPNVVPLPNVAPTIETGHRRTVNGGVTTDEYFASIPLTPISNATVLIQLPQFDPALGELLSVQVCQRVFGDHQLELTSLDPEPRIFEALVRSHVQLFGPPVGLMDPPLISELQQETAIPPTELMFMETATASSPTLEDIAETLIDPSAWGRYVDSDGGGDGTVQFRLEVRAIGQASGSANGIFLLMARTGLRVSVQHNYKSSAGAGG